jgi:N-acetylmuramoyl-L-alanine amidase
MRRNRELVVAIDAGHGGIDAGAHGLNGTQEKRVVFSIAKRLAQLINEQPGMRAVMVRKGDYYIGLRKRMAIARDAKADLFVSIHADAIQDHTVKGASVYTLSNHGASSEAARWLANSENSADLIGGVSLDDKDDVLASVLLDLSQSATKEASSSLAGKVLKAFNSIGKLHKNEVQKAGFMVLKSPDIPSILVETAFISNPSEENELRSSEHQDKIATAMFKGIASYAKEFAPAGTRRASSQ